MPDDKIKISALPSALSLNNTDVFPVVQGMDGDNKITTKAALTVLAAQLLEVMQYNNLDTANKTIVDAINSVLDNLADEYDESLTYSVGDCVQHNGLLYQCNTDISTAEVWDPTHWTQIKAVDVGSGGGGGGLLSDVIAPDYDSSQTYEVGDYVMHEDQLYVCSTDISTAEAWDPTHWTLTSVEAEMKKKADASNTYTKAQTDALVNGLIDDAQTLNNKVWSSKKVSDEILNILPTRTASGSIANFNTSLALPLEMEAEFGADVSGVSAVNVTHCGFNLINTATKDTDWFVGNISDTGVISSALCVYGVMVRCKANVSFCLSFQQDVAQRRIAWYDSNGVFISRSNATMLGKTSIFTAPNNAFFMRWNCNISNIVTTTTEITQELLNTIKPCVNVSDTSKNGQFEIYNPNSAEIIIPLSGTYYNGGKVAVDKDGHRTLAADGQTVTLPDGEPINAFVGMNNVYANSGDCEVVYKKSIDDAIAELQALILNA